MSKYDLPINFNLELPRQFKFGYWTDLHYMSVPPEGRHDDYSQNLLDKVDFIFDYCVKAGCHFTI